MEGNWIMEYPDNPPPLEPRRQGVPWWAWVLVGLGALLVLGAGCCALRLANDVEPDARPGPVVPTANEVLTDSRNEEHPPTEDVEVTRCRVNEWGWAEARVKVTNRSSQASDYSVTVEVVDQRGRRVDELFAFVAGLRPGQESTEDLAGLAEAGDREIECRLLEVERWSAE